jgi:alanyl-tRNA synthetase
VFCLAEGLTPGNVGRRYVIRRIQRRALRFASILGVEKPFMADLYDSVVEAMGGAYPEIKKNPDFIRKALRIEEETFLRTRDRGIKILNDLMEQAKDSGTNRIPGAEAFRLWDTFGFPLDLTVEIAEDEGLSVDREGFETSMKHQKEEARKSWKGAKLDFELELLDELHEIHGQTEFVGYGNTTPHTTELLAFIHKGSIGDTMQAGEEGIVVLKSTPFYAESGGQIGDTGAIEEGDGVFRVTDTQKTPHGIYIHRGRMEKGVLKTGVLAIAKVDAERREHIKRNHSSVHLLQSALKRIVGDHITQAGSYVGPDYSRFDFTHTEGLSREQLAEVQKAVNEMILTHAPVQTDVLPLEEAKKRGAIAVFGEKYGHVVRVVSMAGNRSCEFCGGTHVDNIGEIAHYRIVSESSIASGVRRIEAVTGQRAMEMEIDEQYGLVAPLQNLLASKGADVLERVQGLQNRVKELEKEIARHKEDAALRSVDAELAKAQDLEGRAKLVVTRMDGMEANQLRTVATTLRDKLGATGIAAVLAAADGKVAIVVAVGADAQKEFPAGKVVNALAAPMGGRGGGKPDMAQAGAKDIGKVDEVLANAKQLILDAK